MRRSGSLGWSQVVCGKGWEEEMVQRGLQSSVGNGVWGWGGSLPQTLIAGEETWLLFQCLYNYSWPVVVPLLFTLQEEYSSQIFPLHWRETFGSCHADLSGSWVSAYWHHASATIIPCFLEGDKRSLSYLWRRKRFLGSILAASSF